MQYVGVIRTEIIYLPYVMCHTIQWFGGGGVLNEVMSNDSICTIDMGCRCNVHIAIHQNIYNTMLRDLSTYIFVRTYISTTVSIRACTDTTPYNTIRSLLYMFIVTLNGKGEYANGNASIFWFYSPVSFHLVRHIMNMRASLNVMFFLCAYDDRSVGHEYTTNSSIYPRYMHERTLMVSMWNYAIQMGVPI